MGRFFGSKPSVEQLREAVHQLTLRVKQAEDLLALLEGRYERLRGRMYAKTGPDSPPAPRTKEEILRDFQAARAKGS